MSSGELNFKTFRIASGAAIPLLAAAGATYMYSWGTQDVSGNGVWIFSGAGALTLLSISWQANAKVREHLRGLTIEDAKKKLSIKFTDELRPLAVAVAEVSRLPANERKHAVKQAAQVAVTALRAIADDRVHRSRANVFGLNPDIQQMEAIASVGRGQKPKPFVAGNPRGDAAFSFLESTKPILYTDLTVKRPQGFKLADHDYRTFISVPIWTDGGVYGMVTIDAPEAGSLSGADLALTALIAEMMAAAFEASQDQNLPVPSESPESPSTLNP